VRGKKKKSSLHLLLDGGGGGGGKKAYIYKGKLPILSRRVGGKCATPTPKREIFSSNKFPDRQPRRKGPSASEKREKKKQKLKKKKKKEKKKKKKNSDTRREGERGVLAQKGRR